MTGASATLLLIAIISLNIVWGYPWVGIFSASVTLFVVGFLLNRLFRPCVDVEFSLPTYVHVGKEFTPTVHLYHRGKLATFDLYVAAETIRRRFRKPIEVSHPVTINHSGPQIAMIDAGKRADTRMVMQAHVRGIHKLPRFQVVSSFPFNLFRWVSRIHPGATIAVAPRPLSEDENDGSQLMIDQLDRWTNRWLMGENFEYAGNRDYVMGMPVRRWDFRSWARLGRPIVREFQTPTLQVANIFVDTAMDSVLPKKQAKAGIEMMLRLVATTIQRWQRQAINSRMYVTSEAVESFVTQNDLGKSDPASLFVQLATATSVKDSVSDDRMAEVMETTRDSRSLLFTTRALDTQSIRRTADVHVIRIDPHQHQWMMIEGESNDLELTSVESVADVNKRSSTVGTSS